MPPLRELAPSPGARASSARTDFPALARVRAAEAPVKPTPMTRTSISEGKGAGVGEDGLPASSHQYGVDFSMMDSVPFPRIGIYRLPR